MLVLVLTLLLSACDQTALHMLSGNTMGTTYSIKVIASDVDEAALQAAVEARLAEINALMSTYMPDSELSRFNRAPLGEWFDISPETATVIEMAAEIHALSGGSFDVTVGPLVNLWGFGPTPASDELPSPAAIEQTLATIGFTQLQRRAGALRRDTALYLDLSAIAKGYAVDQLAELLDARQMTDYLVEIGGELRARGVNAQGEAWRIAIELPDTRQRLPYEVIALRNTGMATSGDYRNYFETDGVRYSHTIDPTTGYPIRHTLASVTVLAESTAMADGLATAINVMGAEAGLALAEAQNLAVFVIIKEAGGFVARHSTAFTPYLLAQGDAAVAVEGSAGTR